VNVDPPIATGGREIYPAIAELAVLPRWVCWKLELRQGKETKPPYCVGGRRKAKANDPATWDVFDAVWRSAFVERSADGIGFILGDGIVGIDLDKCVMNDTVAPWALEIVRKLSSYTEFSPSGTGLHIICRGHLDGTGRKIGSVELYGRDRYFTMTARHLDRTPTTINEVPQEVLEALLAGAGHADGACYPGRRRRAPGSCRRRCWPGR
jgi:primase-polymerase (primpol)-like protein